MAHVSPKVAADSGKVATTTTPKEPCVWKDGDCTRSHCCLDGGDYGFQCFERDGDFAVCDESCMKGAHEEDDTVLYDESGNPYKPLWSCSEIGERSQPGCQVFEEKKCPKDRCEWKADKCKSPCSDFPDQDTCSGQDECMWHGDTCKDACWVYGKSKNCTSKENSDRCVQKGDQCTPGCWTYSDKDGCGTGAQCIWRAATESCEEDECSAPGEDCRKTKCCSGPRGGGGMTCFQKDKYFATCAKSCSEEDDWECTKLGNRTKTDPHCSWAGLDCKETGMCCNVGFQCMVKDEFFTGCVQSFTRVIQKGELKQVNVDLPEGWPADPKFIGGGQLEYEMPKASAEDELGTDLYCFMAYLPGSYEEKLMELAKANSASIFACDAYDVYKTWQSNMVGWSSEQTTLENTDVFISVWSEVKKAGRLWSYSWTVKVDPDCLLVPQRLQWHLEALDVPKAQPVYVKNNNLNASQGNNGFLGAVEIFSREALELYYDWWPECKESLGVDSGEDGFMKGCMDALGVGYVVDGGGFKPDDNVEVCKQGQWAAYHPMKDQKNYQCCVDIVNGIDRKTEYGNCPEMPDDWAQKTWPDAGPEGQEPRWRRPA
jgi:hypothetical protein